MKNNNKKLQKISPEKRGSVFFNIIALIGAVLIFVGIAWMIAWNWAVIPKFIRVLILISATVTAFVLGVILKQRDYIGAGRGLIALGAGLYILSVFLIAQTYFVPTGNLQDYAWLLLLCWLIVLITAYLLDSKENLVISIIVFFIWVIIQYFASIPYIDPSYQGYGYSGIIGLFLILLCAGGLLFGMTALHSSLKHRFTSIYRFWSVFYFMILFYLLSFQYILNVLSGYTLELTTFSIFSLLFGIVCLAGFGIGIILAAKEGVINIKEILIFSGIILLLLVLVLSTKLIIDEERDGSCYMRFNCYEFNTKEKCDNVPRNLFCNWDNKEKSCSPLSCYLAVQTPEGCKEYAKLKPICVWDSSEYYPNCREKRCGDYDINSCNKAGKELGCVWNNGYCSEPCYNIQTKSECQKLYSKYGCYWQLHSSYDFFNAKLNTAHWIIWLLSNITLIGFIVLIIGYGQQVGSNKIINLGLIFFVLTIISRYIGFWMDFDGYFEMSLLSIIGGILLIGGAYFIPKWKNKFLVKQQ
jgi:uncharacterized membrane protein